MLHLVDSFGVGGVIRLVQDIVRLSDPHKTEHRVFSLYPDHPGVFPLAQEFRQIGAYRQPASSPWLQRLFQLRRRLAETPLAIGSPLLIPPLMAAYGAIILHQLPQLVRQFRPDVLHAHGTYGFLFGVLSRRLGRIPLVHTVPCLHSQFLEEGFRWMPYLYRHWHRYVEQIFVGMPQDAMAMGLPAAKLVACNGVVDLALTEPYLEARSRWRSAIRQRLGLPEDAVLALSVGRLIPSKGHRHAVEAVARLIPRFPQLHWVLLGEGPQAGELADLAARSQIATRTHPLGFQLEPIPYYAAADFYLRTTLLESDNLCSYHAMALGLPVVGFDTARETELLSRVGHGIAVPAGDNAALAAAISAILSMPDRGQALGSLGLVYAREHLSLAKHVARLTECYEQVRMKSSGKACRD